MTTSTPAVQLAQSLVSTKKETKQLVKKEATHTVHAPIISTPTGNLLLSYTDAIMTALNMNSVKREAVPESTFTAFQGMSKAMSYHGKAGRIEKTGSGMVRLTATGLSFFTARKAKKNLSQSIIDKMIKAIKTGKKSVAKDAVFKGANFKKVSY